MRPCSKPFTHCEPCREVFMLLREQGHRTQDSGSLNCGKMGRRDIVFVWPCLAPRCWPN
ncbi:hypothetical protein PO909_004830 [Leuciscus waleckii]